MYYATELQPEVVEKLVGLREGIPRKDAKEVRVTHDMDPVYDRHTLNDNNPLRFLIFLHF